MLEGIIALLAQDEELTDIFGQGFLYPVRSTLTGPCIVYEYYTLSASESVQTARLQLTVICTNLGDCRRTEAALKRLLLTFGDRPIGNITKSILTGGGQLYDEVRQMHHTLLYFTLTGKE
ncbi:MAG: hypothetical protein PHT58_07225 [Eubacteriales bacterium]|nr:hypothetical protein [Eubacteriales bacterium]